MGDSFDGVQIATSMLVTLLQKKVDQTSVENYALPICNVLILQPASIALVFLKVFQMV